MPVLSNLKPTAPDPRQELAFLQPYVSPATFDFLATNLGLLLVAIAQFFFGSMNVTVKYFLSVTHISIPTLIAVRMGVTSLGCIIGLRLAGDPNPILGPPEVHKWLVLRGTAGWTSLTASYMAMRGLSVSDSAAITFLTPSLTAIAGYLFLGEKCSRREVIAGASCLLGVIIISRPPIIFGGDEEDDPVQVKDPSALPEDQGAKISRVAGASCALFSTFFATAACEYRYGWSIVGPHTHARPFNPPDRTSSPCSAFHRLLRLYLHHSFGHVGDDEIAALDKTLLTAVR